MRLLIQRVSKASVKIDQSIVSQIQRGILVFLGIHVQDTEEKIDWLVEKILHLRIFSGMDRSIKDIEGDILVVSQFTLYADCMKGRRPSFIQAAKPQKAMELYREFITRLKKAYSHVYEGEFGADMKVELINDGPVSLILER